MPKIIIPHRRRKEGRTNYKKRLNLLKSRRVRLVVRRSSKNIYCQLIDYKKDGDKTISVSSSQELAKFGWISDKGNLPSAYLTGLLCGAKSKGAKAVLDIGLTKASRGSRTFAALKGAVDAGLEIAHSSEAFPPEDRVSGKHIADYAAKLKKEKPTLYKKQFSKYIELKVAPEEMPKLFEATKAKILASGK